MGHVNGGRAGTWAGDDVVFPARKRKGREGDMDFKRLKTVPVDIVTALIVLSDFNTCLISLRS